MYLFFSLENCRICFRCQWFVVFTVALDCTIHWVRHTDDWSGSPRLAVRGNFRGYCVNNLFSVHLSHFGTCIVWMVASWRSPLAWCRSSSFCPHFASLLGLLISVGLRHMLWSFPFSFLCFTFSFQRLLKILTS